VEISISILNEMALYESSEFDFSMLLKRAYCDVNMILYQCTSAFNIKVSSVCIGIEWSLLSLITINRHCRRACM
jgi:hypothetical protein